MYDKENVFAKILRGEIPARVIYENGHALSFWDINPGSTKHVLIIPRGEYTDVLDFTKNASAAEQAAFWDAFNKTAEILEISDDCNVLANVGNGVFCRQSVPHYHLHLLGGDKLMSWDEFTK
ncbi:MAG: HIT domain-containing protein [Rickettsiales bacterium]|jgi:diadenosine tetraphosphate (Ap4A) HIT family hydrolase|nr:HIT domain-containing protein [Rickettsiales bacterium]